MVQRVITSRVTDIRQDGDGYVVLVVTAYCTSTIGGGGMDRHVERYDRLTADEARDVLDAIADRALPGGLLEVPGEQLSLV